jgi:hypothetical protein
VLEEQAGAYVRGDVAGFASYMAPSVVLALRESDVMRGTPRKYAVVSVSVDGDAGESDVAYSGRGTRFALVQRWARDGEVWRCVDASCPPERVRHAWWKRLARVASRPASTVERRELG